MSLNPFRTSAKPFEEKSKPSPYEEVEPGTLRRRVVQAPKADYPSYKKTAVIRLSCSAPLISVETFERKYYSDKGYVWEWVVQGYEVPK